MADGVGGFTAGSGTAVGVERDAFISGGQRLGLTAAAGGGDREMEFRALANLRFHPDASAVPFDDFFAEGKADAGARIFAPAVQALEDDEDAFGVFRGNPNAVVAHDEMPAPVFFAGADVNDGRPFAAELDRIADEVLEQLRELDLIGQEGGQGIVRDLGVRLRDGDLEIEEGAAQHAIHVRGAKGRPLVSTRA